MFSKVILFIIMIRTISQAASSYLVCYHGSWSTYRWGNGKFTVEDINPNLCTHIIYGFVGINEDGTIRIMDTYLELDLNNLRRFTGLKNQNPNLKALVAIGGWNEGSEKFSHVAADASKRSTLIKSVVNFLQTYGFDGFDLDWEYPAQRGGSQNDKTNYAILLKELREEFDKHGYLLSAAVAAGAASVDLSYDVPTLSKYLDIINVMAYDLHGVWDGVAGENAPLYPSSADVSAQQKTLNVDAALRGWIEKGADPKKIALGLAAYGRSFTLTNPNNHDIGSPISNGGNPGKYTSESGMIGYHEICELLQDGGWTQEWNDEQKVPYMFKGNQWIGYDNPKSISIKTQFAKSLGLGGVMLWSIETEDFKGLCAGKKYPLLNAVNDILAGNNDENMDPDEQPSVSTEALPSTIQPTGESNADTSLEPLYTETPESSNSPDHTDESDKSSDPINPVSLCKEAGYVRDPIDCATFYYCLRAGNDWIPLRQKCRAPLVFDENLLICNYRDKVKC